MKKTGLGGVKHLPSDSSLQRAELGWNPIPMRLGNLTLKTSPCAVALQESPLMLGYNGKGRLLGIEWKNSWLCPVFGGILLWEGHIKLGWGKGASKQGDDCSEKYWSRSHMERSPTNFY